MSTMSKNLLQVLLEEKPVKAFPVAGMVEAIEKGYLPEQTKEVRAKKSFSPSSLVYIPGGGGCARRWYFAFNGGAYISNVDAYAAANMMSGTMSHERIQNAMKKSGVLLKDEVKVISSDPPVFGFADGVIEWLGEEMVLEIKTMREESYQYRKSDGKAPDYHLMQLLLYMKILGYKRGVLLYESKNSHELHPIPVEMTPEYEKWVDYALDWMRQVRKAWEDKQLPVKTYRSNSKVCKNCPLREVCVEAGKGELDIPALRSIGD